MKKFDVVEVTWMDALHSSGWSWEKDNPIEDMEKELEHKTIGYFLKKTKKTITVCQSLRRSESDNLTDARMMIPLKCVLKVKHYGKQR